MKKKYIKLSDTEKEFIKKIHVVSGIPQAVIRDMFISMLMVFTIDYFDSEEEFDLTIPCIANLKIETTESANKDGVLVKVNMEATPSKTIINEIAAINEGETTPSEELIKEKILNRFKQILKVDEENLENLRG